MLPLATLIQISQMLCALCLQTQLLPATVPALATNSTMPHSFIFVSIIQARGVLTGCALEM